MTLLIWIVAGALCIVGLTVLFAIALGRAASCGDDLLDGEVGRSWLSGAQLGGFVPSQRFMPSQHSYAGLTQIRSTARELSTTGPRVGRFARRVQTASSLTVGSPRVRLSTPRGGVRP